MMQKMLFYLMFQANKQLVVFHLYLVPFNPSQYFGYTVILIKFLEENMTIQFGFAQMRFFKMKWRKLKK